ncbi:hypothetical protein JYB88_02185 [Shewanella cyperi]|uniref:Uncharacterized protein n=1 Tax=Shewanella cyperi TaxID=2814292 RepID=A0A974XNU0_9GAMM|nr:hypothetical protein [Shewanella cyperi]QSX30491.1 hypothetical protein JYB88_02185 [Shewanella cyperi]
MKYLTSPLLLLLLSVPLAAQTEPAFVQKQQLIDKLVSSQPKQMSAEVQRARADIRELQAKAQRHYDAGALELASELQRQAFALAVKLRSQLGGGQAAEEKSLEKFRAMLAVSQDYVQLLRQEKQPPAALAQADTRLGQLKQQAKAGQWQASWDELDDLHYALALQVSRTLDKQERTVELKLDTPQQQYDYEVRIYDGMLLMLERSKEGMDKATLSKLQQQLAQAGTLREKARALVKGKQTAQAVTVMEDANLELKRGMRMIGINLP